jgi:hypothetical protein
MKWIEVVLNYGLKMSGSRTNAAAPANGVMKHRGSDCGVLEEIQLLGRKCWRDMCRGLVDYVRREAPEPNYDVGK